MEQPKILNFKRAGADPATEGRSLAAVNGVNVLVSSAKMLVGCSVPALHGDEGRPKRITYGAYNLPTFRSEDGTVSHGGGKIIDEMRDQRAYTKNSVELRCDALALVVYVAGVQQINPDSKAIAQALRLAIYDHDAKTPQLKNVALADSAHAYRSLHQALISTFNKTSRNFNIAGLTQADLTLVSSHPNLVPSICITDPY